MEDVRRMYNYGCANGCDFDIPELFDFDEEGNPLYVCPECGTEEFSPNVKETEE